MHCSYCYKSGKEGDICMSKAFSVASWNVKHFNKDLNRVNRVISYLKQQNPDIFAIYEVTGKEVFTEMIDKFPDYTVQITEGKQTQEILIGARSNLSPFITQRLEFKSGTTHMRPGQLVTVKINGVIYSLLFLHLASSTEPRGMGLRDDMLYRSVKFRKKLDDLAVDEDKVNYIFLGDLNVMGMYYPYKRKIEPDVELKKWNSRAKRYYSMHLLKKTHNFTWFGSSDSSYEPADLDHVFASNHLEFKSFKNKIGENVEVDVRGWVNEESESSKDTWTKEYSDHSLLFFEVQK